MKKRTQIIATATVVVITSLIIIAYHTEPTGTPISPRNRPVSEVVEVSKPYTQPIETKPLLDEEMTKSITEIEEIIEPPTEDSSIPQTTENIEPPTTPTTSTPKEAPTPKMGDTHIVNGQKQSYFLGFGWVDDMGENEVVL